MATPTALNPQSWPWPGAFGFAESAWMKPERFVTLCLSAEQKWGDVEAPLPDRDKARPIPGQGLIPVIDFQIIWGGFPFSCFYILTQAQKEGGPLHTTVSGKLNSFAPISVAKEENRLVVLR
jgi:hypothetical protein